MSATTRRLLAVGFALAGCLAAPIAPVHADQADARSLVSIRNATADYRAFANSQTDGFTTLVARTDNGDGVIQRQRPEVLLYEPQANGSQVLIGVE